MDKNHEKCENVVTVFLNFKFQNPLKFKLKFKKNR